MWWQKYCKLFQMSQKEYHQQQAICNTQKITVSSNTCFCSSASEENLNIVTLAVSADIQTSINQFLKPEILSLQNKWFCPSCNVLSESTRETCIINPALILIIRFFADSLIRMVSQLKNENFFSCTQSESNKDLTVPITIEDEVSFINKQSLIVSINHSGTLNRDHYCYFIKDLHSSCWYSCNDKSVFNVEENPLNNTTSFILFLQQSLNFSLDFHSFERGFSCFRHCLWM